MVLQRVWGRAAPCHLRAFVQPTGPHMWRKQVQGILLAGSTKRYSSTESGSQRVVTTQVEYKSLPSGDRVAHMWFQGTKKYPILSTAFMQGFQKQLAEEMQEDESATSRTRALFLRTTIVGADISEIKELKTAQDAKTFIRAVESLCNAIQTLKIPVIYVVDGSCLGAGMEVASACDLRIGVEGAIFGMPETKLGMISPAQARLIPNIIGWGRARELLYFGDPITAQTAYRWGFLNALVKESELDAKILEWETRIDGTGHKAMMGQKSLMMVWEKYRDSVEVGVEMFGDTFEDPTEPQAQIQHFLDSRKKKSKQL